MKKIKELKRTQKQGDVGKIQAIELIKGDGRKSTPLTVILHPADTRVNVAQFRRILHGVDWVKVHKCMVTNGLIEGEL